MLVLTRKKKESIYVGENIKITIVSFGGNQVKVGISAPKNIGVYRNEVYERIQKEKESMTKQEVLENEC